MGLLQGGQRGEVCCGAFAAETDVGAERVLNGEPGRQAGSLPDMRDQGGAGAESIRSRLSSLVSGEGTSNSNGVSAGAVCIMDY